MRFGQEKMFDGKIDQLFQRLADYGNAVYYDYARMVPKEGLVFVYDQLNRFKFPVDKSIEPVIYLGIGAAVELIDYYDPYCLFYDFSDVQMTCDWMEYTYEIEGVGREIFEADPDHLETFSFVPGAAESFFNQYIQNPGLENLPAGMGECLREVSDEVLCGDRIITCLVDYPFSGEYMLLMDRIESFCRLNGWDNPAKWAQSYVNISVWAGFMWMMGPYSRKYRLSISDITEAAISCGEAILYEGVAISPENYRKVPRPPQSCYQCGIDAWCVEVTLDDYGQSRYICEGCLSEGMDLVAGATCGSKICKYFQCPHNAYSGMGSSAMREGMKAHGQLAARAENRKKSLLQEASKKTKKLLRSI